MGAECRWDLKRGDTARVYRYKQFSQKDWSHDKRNCGKHLYEDMKGRSSCVFEWVSHAAEQVKQEHNKFQEFRYYNEINNSVKYIYKILHKILVGWK